MFSQQAVAVLISSRDLAASVGEGFQNRDAVVLIRVCAIRRKGFDEELSEDRFIALEARLGCGDEHTVRTGQHRHEIAARACRVDKHDCLGGKFVELRRKFRRRNVRPRKIEA